MFKDFLIAIVFCVSVMSHAQQQWQLKKDANGIQIYTRSLPNINFKEYKAVTSLKTSIDVVLKALLEAPKYYENCRPGISYYVKPIEKNKHVFYAQKALPWPIKDRDIVTLLTVEKISAKKIKLTMESLPMEIPEKTETIRIKTLMGHWLLEEKENKTIVTQQLFLNPEGNLPPFVVNTLLIKGPYDTFKELQNVAEKAKTNTFP